MRTELSKQFLRPRFFLCLRRFPNLLLFHSVYHLSHSKSFSFQLECFCLVLRRFSDFFFFLSATSFLEGSFTTRLFLLPTNTLNESLLGQTFWGMETRSKRSEVELLTRSRYLISVFRVWANFLTP